MPNPQGHHPQAQRQQQQNRSRNRPSTSATRPVVRPRIPLRQLLRVASVASGIQFGWALQLSLLTPYVQQLGIPHQWASIIWLCGPVSGLFVQPLVGIMSDRCTSRFGRRRPFILAGTASIIVAVIIIGYAADIGWLLGDNESFRPAAITVFVIGFWILDVANNVTQGPCRALLADLTSKDARRTRVANAYFSLFMAIGNILGYATGSYSGWYKIFAFTLSPACTISCANLKSAFFLDVAFIVVTTYLSISAAHEVPLNLSGTAHAGEETGESGSAEEAFMWELFGTFKYFTFPIWIVLSVTALTWIGWFPFILFDTDWMGREIYGGDPSGGLIYDNGVRMGALGLLLNSVVLGVTSLLMEKLCRKRGAGFVWGISNILMAVCFLAMLVVTYVANSIGYVGKDLPPPTGIVIAALLIFTILGFPLSITYSVPYALISTHIEPLGLGQGLSMGVLNLAIVVPQALEEIKEIGKISCPTAITGLLLYSRAMISMIFLGYLGEMELAGGSLSIGFANITGYSVISGLAMGMEPICGQAYGAKQWKILGLTLQRTVLLLLSTSIPISFTWLNMERILLWLGQDQEIASMAQTFIFFSIPDLFLLSLLHPLRIYLRTQNITLPLTYCSAISVLLHVPLNFLLVTHLKLGIAGVATAMVLTNLNLILFLSSFVYFSGVYKDSWVSPSLECIKGWSSLLALAIPTCVSVCLEWWWYEFMIMLCGLLVNPKATIASMGILIQTTSLVYVFPSSLSLGVSTRVGNELGANRPEKARISMIVSLFCAVGLGVGAMLFTTLMRHRWGRLFTSDGEILELTAIVLPIAGLCELGNCPQTTGCGVLRGSARPTIGANINLGSFYFVGMPVAILLGFVAKMGFAGLWLGLLAAQASCAVLMLVVLCRTDWNVQVQRAKELTKTSTITTTTTTTTTTTSTTSCDVAANSKLPTFIEANNNNNAHACLEEIVITDDELITTKTSSLETDPLIITTTRD